MDDITGHGRNALAEALEDSFGSIERSTYLTWMIDDQGLHLRRAGPSDKADPGWQKLFFLRGPGGFSSRAIAWLKGLSPAWDDDDVGWKLETETTDASGNVTTVLITPCG